MAHYKVYDKSQDHPSDHLHSDRKCFNCHKEVSSDFYCYGCKKYVCDDCEAGFSVATAFSGCSHEPEDHLVDYDGDDL